MATSDVLPTTLEIWGGQQKPSRASADKLPRNVFKPIRKPGSAAASARKPVKRASKKGKR